jgi:hypothetical protein
MVWASRASRPEPVERRESRPRQTSAGRETVTGIVRSSAVEPAAYYTDVIAGDGIVLGL